MDTNAQNQKTQDLEELYDPTLQKSWAENLRD